MAPVQKGDLLIIPAPSDESTKGKRITISWMQSWNNNTADYYTIIAKNKTQDDTTVVVFIQVEYYNDEKLAEYGTKTGEGFEIIVTDKLRYGQRGGVKEGRFVVLHDPSRDMYETRFIDAVLKSPVLGLADQVDQAQGVIPVDVKVNPNVCRSGVSPDFLKTFR